MSALVSDTFSTPNWRLVSQCWPTFKGKFLGPSYYMPYMSGWHFSIQHWFLWHFSISAISDPISTKLSEPNFLGVKIFLDHHFVRRKLLGSKIIWTQNYLGPKIIGTKNILDPKFYLDTIIFWPRIFWPSLFLTQNFSDPKLFEHTKFLDTKFLCTKFFF